MEMISVEREAEAMVHGAFQRVERAKEALRDFALSNMVLIGSELGFKGSPEEGGALQRQHFVLKQELDAAVREHQKSLADWAEIKQQAR